MDHQEEEQEEENKEEEEGEVIDTPSVVLRARES